MEREAITAWVTKYALTEGIQLVSGEVCHDINSAMLSYGAPSKYGAAHRESRLLQEKKMARKKMKVFVWEGVLIDHTSGMMVAIAPTVEEARARLLKECNYIPEGDLNKPPKEFDLSEPAAFVCWGGS